MKLKGIDVSVWNGKIDWAKVKPQIDFAILRAGFGKYAKQKDGQFDNYYEGCKDNNIQIGVYWYSYAETVEDAEKEANACIEVLKGKKFDMPVWYDIEENKIFATGKENVSKIADTFCAKLAAAGYKVGIYSFYAALKSYFTKEVKEKYDIWLAHVGPNGAALDKTSYGETAMWQYSWKGKFDGIKGDVDTDYCYKDYRSAAMPKENKKTPTTPQTPPVVAPDKSKDGGEKIDVIYSAYIGKWLGTIVNCNDTNNQGFAGVKGRSISGIAAKVTKGKLRYRVHTTNGKWLGWIEGFNQSNWSAGVAGIAGRNIDGFQAELIDVPGYKVEYRVSTLKSKNYLSWISNYGEGSKGYAGIYGQNIDRIQMRIVKV